MAVTFLGRDAWTTHGPAKPLTELTDPTGVAVHWPGATGQIGQSRESIASRLEGYRAFHVNTRGWNDIAYQMAIDNAGRVWKLRGEAFMSAANGDQDVNRAWGAVLLMLDQDDRPSDAMVEAFQTWRTTRWLIRFPRASKIAPHSAVRPSGDTDCPGDAARALIRSGRLMEEPDVALTDVSITEWKSLLKVEIVPVSDPDNVNAGDPDLVGVRTALGWTADRSAAHARQLAALGAQLGPMAGEVAEMRGQLAAQDAKLDEIAMAVAALGANPGN